MKKAQSLLMAAFFVLIAGMTILLMFQVAERYSKEEVFQKHTLTKDLGLFVDTLYATPGSYFLTYARPMASKTVEFKENAVHLDLFEGEFVSSIKSVEGIFTDPKQLFFLKRADVLNVVADKSKLPKSGERLVCSSLGTKGDIAKEHILLDPQHGGKDPGYTAQKTEAELVGKMAQSFLDANLALREKIILSRPLDLAGEVSIAERMAKKSSASMIISLSTGVSQETSSQDVIAYIPAYSPFTLKSSQLACHMLNRLLDDFPLQSVQIQEASVIEQPLLSESAVSVVLKIGNMRYSGQDDMLKDPFVLGSLIYKGVVDYLG